VLMILADQGRLIVRQADLAQGTGHPVGGRGQGAGTGAGSKDAVDKCELVMAWFQDRNGLAAGLVPPNQRVVQAVRAGRVDHLTHCAATIVIR